VSTNGKFVLTPAGTSNYTFHAYLSTLGLPIGPGDVLVWSWTANAAAGPPIAFDIHSHIGGYAEYYNTTADRANNSWNVPGSSDYAVQYEPEPAIGERHIRVPADPAPPGSLAVLSVARRAAIDDWGARVVFPPEEEGRRPSRSMKARQSANPKRG